MSFKYSITMSGMMFWVISSCLSAQTVALSGRLVTEDTQGPLPGVTITAISLTKPVSLLYAKTEADGGFTIAAKAGIFYKLCSAATGRYSESCQFSRPVIIKASSDMAPVQLSAPTGIRMRVRIIDPDEVLSSPNGSTATDPLLLHVFAGECGRRCHGSAHSCSAYTVVDLEHI